MAAENGSTNLANSLVVSYKTRLVEWRDGSIPAIHVKIEGKNQLHKAVLPPPHTHCEMHAPKSVCERTYTHTHTHTHTHTSSLQN